MMTRWSASAVKCSECGDRRQGNNAFRRHGSAFFRARVRGLTVTSSTPKSTPVRFARRLWPLLLMGALLTAPRCVVVGFAAWRFRSRCGCRAAAAALPRCPQCACQDSDELPHDIPSVENPIPFTVGAWPMRRRPRRISMFRAAVNSRPLDDTPFVSPYVPCLVRLRLRQCACTVQMRELTGRACSHKCSRQRLSWRV
jgi:hypothetical protein